MEIWDSGMPPREEAAAELRDLQHAPLATAALERARLHERIPATAWIVLATVLGAVLVAWFFARI